MSRPDIFGLLGTVLDARYRVEQIVGEGGFGVVYRAMQVNFDEPVAVKVLKLPAHLTEEQRGLVVSTFRAEGKHLRKLSLEHPAFVRALDAGITEANGSPAPYLVLEWLDGEPLERELRRRRDAGEHGRSLGDAMALLQPVFGALAHAHAQRVAHRDVKPANIFLTRINQGVTAKLLDFGMAKVMTETGTEAINIATQGAMAGFTPPYAAPEQWNKKLGATGPWTDVYALALVLVELLTDRMALIGDDMPQFYAATMDLERPTPLARGAKVSLAVENVFANALKIHPKDRIRSARDFWNALAAAVRDDVTQGTAGAPDTITLTLADLPEPPQPQATDAPPRPSATPTAPLSSPTKPQEAGARTSPKVDSTAATTARSAASGRTQILSILVVAGLAVGITIFFMRLDASHSDASSASGVVAPAPSSTDPSQSTSSRSKPPRRPKVLPWYESVKSAPEKPQTTSSTPKERWLGLYKTALRLIGEKKYQQAKSALLQALPIACTQLGDSDPSCPETYKQLGLLAYSSGNLEDAEENLRKAAALLEQHGDPDLKGFNDPLQYLVIVLEKLGKVDEAAELMGKLPEDEAEEDAEVVQDPIPPDASVADSAAPPIDASAGGIDAGTAISHPPEGIYDVAERELREEMERRRKASQAKVNAGPTP